MNYYDEVFYREISVKKYDDFYEKLIDKINVRGHVLDLGCGTGCFLQKCKKRKEVVSITGIDISSKAIEKCGDVRNFHCGSIADVTAYVNKCYDVITCFGVLEHVEDKESVLRQIRSICKKNSAIIFVVPIKEFLFYKFGFKGTAQKDYREDVYLMPVWEKMFNQAGFIVVEKWIDRHMLTRDWMFSKGLVMFPVKFCMAVLTNLLPLSCTYQVFFSLKIGVKS